MRAARNHLGAGQRVCWGRMRAAVFTQPGAPLEIETLEIDPPGPGEVAVRMLASGVCHSDLHVIEGEWAVDPPLVLGHEGCAEVEAVGGAVHGLSPGDRVVLSWYYPCGRCRRCHQGRPWLCEGSNSVRNAMEDGGSRLRRPDGQPVFPYLTVGSFGERAVVPAAGAVRVPAELPADVGALIGCGIATGVGAVVNTARVEPGASVAVIGCGGVGLAIVMGAVLAGAARVIAIDLNDAKLELARDLGATHAVRGGEGAAAGVAAACPGGPDYVFEAIGTGPTIELAVELLPRGGTAVMVGLTPEGVRAGFDAFSFADGGRTLLGSNYGSTRPGVDFPRLASLYLAGRLPIDRVITERIQLDGVNRAFDLMRRGDGARRVIVY
jgi:S-(hydroxymethyl)glutathione dehydrogenase / alcohol dehydrogenase